MSEDGIELRLPNAGPGEVRAWLEPVGARVAAGTPLVVIEGESATVQLRAPADVVVEAHLVPVDAVVPPGGAIARLRRVVLDEADRASQAARREARTGETQRAARARLVDRLAFAAAVALPDVVLLGWGPFSPTGGKEAHAFLLVLHLLAAPIVLGSAREQVPAGRGVRDGALLLANLAAVLAVARTGPGALDTTWVVAGVVVALVATALLQVTDRRRRGKA